MLQRTSTGIGYDKDNVWETWELATETQSASDETKKALQKKPANKTAKKTKPKKALKKKQAKAAAKRTKPKKALTKKPANNAAKKRSTKNRNAKR